MTDEQQLKLQAFLDDELPEAEKREVAAWVARDSEATALLNELRNTRRALAGFDPELKLPESREFYWSKIEREIQASQPAAAPEKTAPGWHWLWRLLIPASGLAVLAIAVFITERQMGVRPSSEPQAVQMETELADSGSFTYRDETQGMTVVWLSYPAENELAQADPKATLE